MSGLRDSGFGARSAEAVVKDAEAKFRAIFERAAIGVAVVDLEHTVMEANPALGRMLGYKLDELKGMDWEVIIHPEDGARNKAAYLELLAGLKDSHQAEVRFTTKEGVTRHGHVTVSVVRDANFFPSSLVALLEDITDRKTMEEDLKMYSTKLEEMVKERTRELNESNRQLLKAERLAAIGSVAAQVGHDLRSPLTAVRTNLYYVQNALPEEERRKLGKVLNSMDESLVHANGIIADLFDYSRKANLKMEELDLGEVVRSALRQVSFPAHVQLVTEPFPDALISGDATYLVRIFQNIIFNAIDAMPGGGNLTVGMVVRRKSVVISFADTGQGISKESMGKLFTPFFTTKPKGTGLGLAICKRLVEAHHGTISVDSELGKGTTFALMFPLRRNPAG